MEYNIKLRIKQLYVATVRRHNKFINPQVLYNALVLLVLYKFGPLGFINPIDS